MPSVTLIGRRRNKEVQGQDPGSPSSKLSVGHPTKSHLVANGWRLHLPSQVYLEVKVLEGKAERSPSLLHTGGCQGKLLLRKRNRAPICVRTFKRALAKQKAKDVQKVDTFADILSTRPSPGFAERLTMARWRARPILTNRKRRRPLWGTSSLSVIYLYLSKALLCYLSRGVHPLNKLINLLAKVSLLYLS